MQYPNDYKASVQYDILQLERELTMERSKLEQMEPLSIEWFKVRGNVLSLQLRKAAREDALKRLTTRGNGAAIK